MTRQREMLRKMGRGRCFPGASLKIYN
jgi:hypothetical protein